MADKTETKGTKTAKPRKPRVKKVETKDSSPETETYETIMDRDYGVRSPSVEEIASSAEELPKGGNKNFLNLASVVESDSAKFFYRRQYLLTLPKE